jgi:hypothetical protein
MPGGRDRIWTTCDDCLNHHRRRQRRRQLTLHKGSVIPILSLHCISPGDTTYFYYRFRYLDAFVYIHQLLCHTA